MFDLREYREKNVRLSDWLPWAGMVDPGVMINKDGSFMTAIRFRGPDLDSSTAAELVAARGRLNNALKRLGSNWCVHIEARRMFSQEYPADRFPDPVSQAIDDERRFSFTEEGNHFDSEYFMSLTFLPPAENVGKTESLFYEGMEKKTKGVDYQQFLDKFKDETQGIYNIVRGVMPEVHPLRGEQLLAYLHNCVSHRYLKKVAVPQCPFYLDEMITDSPLVGGVQPKLGPLFLKTISVRQYAATTVPGLLDQLNQLPVEYRWVVRFIPMDKPSAQKAITTIRRQWFAKRKGIGQMLRESLFKSESQLEDSDSANKARDADQALQELGADACSYGYLTLTLTVWDRSQDRAAEKAAAVQQVLDSLGLVSEIEEMNAIDAWLGSIPGNPYADVRRPLVSSLNLCDLIPFSAVWSGPERNKHLEASVHMHTKTKGSTPFRFDLFQGDVGHTMIVGPTGAGKSTLLCILAAQWLRYRNAQVYFFDKGASCRALTYAVGGDFYDLGANQDAGNDAASADSRGLAFQPLGRCDEDAERIWAVDWICDILQRENVTVAPAIRDEVFDALKQLGSMDRQDRSFSTLHGLIQNKDAKEALNAYTHNGAYGYLLDAETDSLDAGRWQAFEMEELMSKKKVLVPVLTYMFHRLEERFGKPGTPTLLILDEAWVFLSEGYFADKIREWLKVLRKKNVAVVFATQDLADIEKSHIADALKQNCPTRIYLPNAKAMDPSIHGIYRGFGLNNQQIMILSQATPKMEYYYSTHEGNRLFEIGFGDFALAFCGASGPDDQDRINSILRRIGGRDYFAWRFLMDKGYTELASFAPAPPAEQMEGVALV